MYKIIRDVFKAVEFWKFKASHRKRRGLPAVQLFAVYDPDVTILSQLEKLANSEIVARLEMQGELEEYITRAFQSIDRIEKLFEEYNDSKPKE